MAKADVFHVVNNVLLDFESEGLKYEMKLLIEDGLILLKSSKGEEKIILLGDKCKDYTGEVTLVVEKPKKRRSKKKK